MTSELARSPILPWTRASDALDASLFYLLVAAALFGIPLITIGDDAITVFDAALVGYLLVRFPRRGFTSPSPEWRRFFVLWAVYGMYLLLRFLAHPTLFAGLLVAKQFEHLLFVLILIDRLDAQSSDGVVKWLAVLITATIGYQILYFHDLVGGIGTNYRLGIPFAVGVSSNPAGFFLGAWIVVLLNVRGFWRSFPKLSLASLLLALYAIAQTRSRTNLLALLVVLFLTSLVWVWRVKGWRWVVATVAAFVVAYVLVVVFVDEAGPLTRIVRILKDPTSVFEDGSFAVRFQEAWPRAFALWKADARTIFIGNGLDRTGPVDGTIPRLLANQGAIGLLFFLSVWYAHFLVSQRSTAVVMLLVFSFINGINAETLVISYRSIQAYLIVLMIAVYYGTEQWNTTQTKNMKAD